ncbi:hypothetical protein DSM112329_00173 [Paraconexibacter sp. AEG42_29]|uniref:VWFA domain-containing protein n=1 Tax=Paraconexibacter sp. AEG42_29 TaxID=2997339 RepID=A0AAU7AP19_9ACTN
MNIFIKVWDQPFKFPALIIPAVVATFLATGCGQQMQAVCPDVPERVVLVPSTSASDLATSQDLGPAVAAQAVARAANSCGRISVGLQNNAVESDLELLSLELTPKRTMAFNAKPVIKPLIKEAEAFVQDTLLGPLATIPPTNGSPFINGLIKMATELNAHGGVPATIILLGDGIAIERTPSGGLVDFRTTDVPKALLDEFVPLLAPLKASCVMLVSAGAESDLTDETLRNGQKLLGDTLNEAGIGFVATRSRDVPTSCPAIP